MANFPIFFIFECAFPLLFFKVWSRAQIYGRSGYMPMQHFILGGGVGGGGLTLLSLYLIWSLASCNSPSSDVALSNNSSLSLSQCRRLPRKCSSVVESFYVVKNAKWSANNLYVIICLFYGRGEGVGLGGAYYKLGSKITCTMGY